MSYTRQKLADVHAAVVRSIKEKDAPLFASLYTEDGVLILPDGQVVRGREQIEHTFRGWLDAGMVNQKVDVIDFDSDARIAVEEGVAEGAFQVGEGSIVARSNYLIVHRLEADNVWRMHQDIWTAIGEGDTRDAGY